MDMWHTRTNYVNLVNSKNICSKPGEFGGVFPKTSFGWFRGSLFIWPSGSTQEIKNAFWKMPKKGQSSLGRFSQIGYKTRYELQIYKLATHWKPNIKIRLKLLFSSFLAIKNLRNRIIFQFFILFSLFGEISPVNAFKKGYCWGVSSLVVATQRSYHPLFAMGHRRNNNNNSHVSHDAIGTVASTCQQTKHSRQHSCLPRRSRSSSNIHSCLPSHDVIGSLSRTFSRHSCCRQRRDSTGRRTLKTFISILSVCLSVCLICLCLTRPPTSRCNVPTYSWLV